jgi:hypothetical protein
MGRHSSRETPPLAEVERYIRLVRPRRLPGYAVCDGDDADDVTRTASVSVVDPGVASCLTAMSFH